MKKLVPAVLGAAASVAAIRRFHQDMARARLRLASVPGAIVDTRSGPLEYADVGDGEPVLVVHGIFGGRDQGLLSFDDLLPSRRVVAPSRFGYLGSAMPSNASPALQADAFADLLDMLGIEQIDVIGYSAGSTSVLQLALRHPSRVRGLVVMCGDWPGATATAPPRLARLAYRSDALMWIATTLAGPALLRFIAGVPGDYAMSAGDRAKARNLMDRLFPVRARSDGTVFDAYVGNPDVNTYPLEDIAVPTLIVHARDDAMAPYAAARAAARRIPGAQLVAHERGGHLMLGRKLATRDAVASFLVASDTGCAELRPSA